MAKKKEPEFIKSKMNTPMINYRVYHLNSSERVLYNLILFLAGGIGGLILFGGLFKDEGAATLMTWISNAVIFVVIGLAANRFFIKQVRDSLLKKRKKELQKQFADFLELIATALASGYTMQQSFEVAHRDLLNQYSEKDMMVIEIEEILKSVNNGITLEEALDNFGQRSDDEDVQNFANVVVSCKKLGGDFKSVVRRTKEIISDKIAVQNEITTKVTSNKLQMNAMSLMPIVLIGMIKISNPVLAENLATPMGVIATLGATVLFAVAYVWGRKIIDIR